MVCAARYFHHATVDTRHQEGYTTYMAQVQRYHYTETDDLVEYPEGDFVRYEDYERVAELLRYLHDEVAAEASHLLDEDSGLSAYDVERVLDIQEVLR